MKIILDITPMGAVRTTRFTPRKPGSPAARYDAYKKSIAVQWLKQAPPGELGGWCVTMCFHIPMPPSWSKKKRAQMSGQPHRQKPDLDNLCKGVLDAVCESDAHIWDVRMTKMWLHAADEPHHPDGYIVVEW